MKRSALRKLTNYNPTQDSSKLVKIGEASQLLGVSIDTLRRWEKKGWLRAIKTPGGTRLYDKQQLTKLNPNLKRGPKNLLSPIVKKAISENEATESQVTQYKTTQTDTNIVNPNLSLESDKQSLRTDALKPILKTISGLSPESVEEELGEEDRNALGYDLIKPFQALKPNLMTGFLSLVLITALILPAFLLSNYLSEASLRVKNTQNASILSDKIYGNSLVSSLDIAKNLAGIFSPQVSRKLFGIFQAGSPPGSLSEKDLKTSGELATRRVSGDLKGVILSGSNGSVLGTKRDQARLSSGQVLAESTPSANYLQINIDTELNGNLAVDGEGFFTQNVTAPNLLYGIQAGTNISITGDAQNPTISTTGSNDTLQTVTARGAVTTIASTFSGGLTATSLNLTSSLNMGQLSSDPTGVNGATYYNTGSNKFRCYVNGSWANCDTDTDTVGGDGDITGVTAGNGLTGGGSSGAVTLTVDATTTSTTTTTSANSGLEATSTGIRLLGGCSDTQVLKWNSTSAVWECGTGSSGTGTAGTLAKFTSTTAIGDSLISESGTTISLSTATALTASSLATITASSALALNGPATITTDQTSLTLFNTTATTVNFAGAATTALNLGNGSGNYTAINLGSGSGTHTINIAGTGATAADVINIGTGGTAADTITIGNTASSTSIALNAGSGATTITNATTGSTTFSSTTSGADSIAIKPQSTTTTNAFTATISSEDLTVGAQTYLLPNLAAATSDTFCIKILANCFGSGSGGVSATGTQNSGEIAYFTGDDNIDGDSSFLFSAGATSGNTFALSNTLLTTGKLNSFTGTSTPVANTATTQNLFDVTYAQSTLANTNGFVGLGVNFTNNPSVAGNTEYAARIQNQVTTNATDNAVAALLLLDNADTSGAGSTVVTDALRITNSGAIAAGITNGITFASTTIDTGLNFSSTPTTNYVNGTNWGVTAAGAETLASNLAVNGGAITTTNTTATIFNSTATTLSLGGAATTALNIGNGSGNYTDISLGSGAGTHTINIAGTGATAADTINIGTGGTSADTITIGNNASTTSLALTSGTGDITLTSADDIIFTPSDDITSTFAAGSQISIDASSTPNTTTSGVIDLNVTSATNNNRAASISTTYTSTGAATSYGLENLWASSAVVTGVAVNQTAYGIYNTATKTGADDATGTYSLYGLYSTASNTGSTDAGTKNTYGGYFDATGDTAGTASVYGVYIDNVSGGDTNVGLCFDCDGTWTASTVASGIQFGSDANAVTLYRSASDILKTDDSLVVGINYDQSASSGTFKTGTGAVSLNGDTTVAAGKNFSLASGTGVFSQSFTPAGTTSSATAASIAQTVGIDAADQTLTGLLISTSTNSDTDTGDTIYGINIDNVTASSANEYALRLGSGWDGIFYIEKGATDLIISATAPTGATRTATIPALAADDTFCFATLSNCTGAGGGSGVTFTGYSANAVTKFTSTTGEITASNLTDDGTTVTVTAGKSFALADGAGVFTQTFSPSGASATATGTTITPKFTLDATDQTLTGLLINPNTNSNNDAGDILYGINVQNITASSADEYALRIGSGYDTPILFEGGTFDVKVAVAAPTQAITITIPDVNSSSASFCLTTGNCAGTGAGVTQSGTNANTQIAYFTSSNNLTSASNFTINPALTTGTLFTLSSAVTLTGTLTGQSISLSGTTATGQSATALSIAANPTVTNSGSGTYAYKGIVVTGSAITQDTAAGIDTFTGIDITTPAITQTTGTITSTGAKITLGAGTTGGTINGVNIVPPATTGAGTTTNAINIGDITTSSGTDTAILIGTNWDTVLNSANLDISGAGAITGATGITSSGTINFSGLTASRFVTTDGSSNLATTGASAALAASLSDETGSAGGGLAVFSISPQITTSLTTDSTSFDLLNTTATTINFGGATTTALNLGNGSGNYTAINLGSGAGTHTINIAGTGATAADIINIGTGGTGADTITIGSSASTTSVAITSGTGDITLSSADDIFAYSTQTAGNILTVGANSAVTTGTGLVGQLIDLATNYTTADDDTTGLVITLDTASDTDSTVDDITGLEISGGTLTVNGASAAPIWEGVEVTVPIATTTSGTSATFRGIDVVTQADTQSTDLTTNYIGFDISSAGALTQDTAAGTIAWEGLNISIPALTETTGTVTAKGIDISTIGAAGAGAETTAINIGTGPGGAGTEYALAIGASWDQDINATTSLDIAIGGTAELVLSATNLNPGADGGNSLGASGTEWANLFLNTGGKISFEADDITLTHSSNTLTLAGGDLDAGNNLFVNIGAAGTDFTSGGGLTLAEAFIVNDDATFTLAAGEKVLIDAATTDSTGTAGALDIDLDATSSQSAADFNIETITDAGVDTLTGLKVTATATSTDADVIYGIQIADLGGTATAGNEYAIYQAGTAWDYGLYIEDAGLFNTTLVVNGTTLGIDADGDTDNLITVGASGTAGAAGNNLYWGDKLLCTAATANCGWQASGATSPWTTDSNVVNLNTDTDTVTIGSAVALGKLAVDGDADEIQLLIQGNATQTSSLVVFETSAGADQFTFSNTGSAVFTGSADGTDALTLTAGDILITDGDFDLSAGDFNVNLDAADTANFSGTAPASVAGNGTSAGTNTLLVTGTVGGASSGTTGQTGGTGGAVSLTGGIGGAVAGASGIGGVGGAATFAGGAGGNGAATGGAGGAVSITAGAAGTGGNANGGTLTLNSGAVTGSGTSTLNLGSANATTVNLATATSATTLNIGAVSTTAVTVAIAGGSGDTGCTIAGASGNLTCTGDITGSASGTVGFWSRSGTTLQPATDGDVVTIDAIPTGANGLSLAAAAGVRTVALIDINENNTSGAVPTIQWDSAETRGGLLDANLTGALGTENFIDITTSAAFTSNLFDFNLTAAGSGNVIDITTSSSATSSNLIDLNFGNIADTGDAINISMGAAAVGAQALVVSTSAGIRTASAIAITENNTSGTVPSIQYDSAQTRGGFLDLNATGILATENLIDINASAAFTSTLLDISSTGSTTAGDIAQFDYTRTYTGDTTVNTANALSITRDMDIDDSTAGVVTLTVSAPLVTITEAVCTPGTNDVCTFSGNLLQVDGNTVSSGNLADLNIGNIAHTGDAINISMGAAAVGAQGLVLSTSAGIRTASAIQITENNTSGTVPTIQWDSGETRGGLLDANLTGALITENLIDITTSAAWTSNLIDINVGAAAATGDVINIALGATAPAAQALVVTGSSSTATGGIVSLAIDTAAAQSADIIDITSTLGIMDGSDIFQGIDINITGADHTGSNTITGIDFALTTPDAQATETALNISANWDSDINATTDLTLGIGGTNQLTLTDGALSGTTDNDIDLGTSSSQIKDLYIEGNILADTAFDIDIDDNTASSLTISEGTNNYFLLTTTNDAEVMTLDLPVGGATSQTMSFGISNIAKTINIGTGTAADTINIGTGGTTADIITVGNNAAAGSLALTSGTGDITLTSTDDIILTPTDDITSTFAAGSQIAINASTTPNTTTSGVIDLNVTSATDNNKAVELSTTFTATGATTSYGLSNLWASTAVVTGASVSQTAYGIYNTAAKTGADDATGTYSLYGLYSTATNTGSTAAGTKNTYGGYFDATGDTAGTASVYGVYIDNVSGGDTNVGLCFDCDGTWTASTVASGIQFGTDANAVTLYRSASDTLKTDDSLSVGANLTVIGTTGLTFSGAGADVIFTNAETINNDTDNMIAFTGNVDGTDTFFSAKVVDGATTNDYGVVNILAKGDTGNPASCSVGDIYINDADDAIYACTTANTWEQLDGAGASTTLQNAYDNSTTPATITLSSTDDSLVFTNPTSSGTDLGYLLHLNQAHTTGNVSALDITQASSGGDAVNLTANSIDTETGLDISTTALTSGSGIKVTGSGATMTTGGELVDLALGANTVGAGVTITSTGAYTGTGAADGLINLTANSLTTGYGTQFLFNGLTSGRGINVTSSSAVVTTGNLIYSSLTGASAFSGNLNYMDWTPGSATTASGDLFRLHIGPNGTTTGNLFNIVDDTSSIFSVSETAMTTSLPSNFTAAGDVSVAYDIVFTNPTASYIKSQAPMYLVAGETFNSSDLTLQTYNTGAINLVTAASGTINLAPDPVASTINIAGSTNTAANTINIGTGTGLSTINIGTGNVSTKVIFAARSAVPAAAEFTTNGQVFFGNLTNVTAGGRMWVRSNNMNFRFISTSNVADYSEYLKQNETSEPGDVMVLDGDNFETVKKSNESYDQKVLGVITKYGTGNNAGICWDEVSCDKGSDPNWANVGMLGQVYTKVSVENGNIKPGDPLVTSSSKGVAMKATKTGRILGYALDFFDGSKSGQDLFELPTAGTWDVQTPSGTKKAGKIVILLQAGWYDPAAPPPDIGQVQVAQTAPETPYEPPVYSLSYGSTQYGGQLIGSEAVIANLDSGYINAQSISVGTGSNSAFKVDTKGNVILGGSNLTTSSTDGFAYLPSVNGTPVAAPTSINGHTAITYDKVNNQICAYNGGWNCISASNNDAAAALSLDQDGALVVPDLKANKITVASDVIIGGIASATGFNLDASSINQTGALATLPVNAEGKVTLADVVNSLNSQISQTTQNLSTLQNEQASQSAQLAEARILGEQAVSQAQSLDEKVASTSANLSSLSDQISELLAGLSDGSESTPSGDLDLTPPDVMFATSSATLANLDVTEKISTVNLSTLDATVSATFKSLGETFLGQTTIAGDLSVDGTLSFTNGNSINAFPTLFLQNNPLAQAIDIFNGAVTIDTTGLLSANSLALSSESLGEATIGAGQIELTIPSSLISPTSRIFLTPISPILGNLYVGIKVSGQSFKVRLSEPNFTDVKFNWMVIQSKEASN